MFRLLQIITFGMLISSSAWADHDWDDGDDYGHTYYREEIIYSPPVVEYVETPVIEYVSLQPRYYAPPPPVYHSSYDQRSPQGLLGGIFGSAIGYELGAGDPVAAGLGAAAGAWLGNGGY